MTRINEVFDGQGNVIERVEVSLTPSEKIAFLAEYRYKRENEGLQVGGTFIQTDYYTRTNILGSLQIDGSIKWKTPSGFIDLTKAQRVSISGAIGDHVQKCFDAEAVVLENIDDYDTFAEIEAAFQEAYDG
jgi:hypothetical protein